jgi:trans-aconitate methyltransferase
MFFVQYSSNPRSEVLSLIDFSNVKSVIEFGCSDGATLLEVIKNFPQTKVHGFDLDKLSIAQAKSSGISAEKLDLNDLSQLNLIVTKVNESEVILLLDVLEHILNPESFLLFLRENTKAGTQLIISLPNVRNWRTIFQLINNDWRYEDTGIFDKTHLRFYAKKSALRLSAVYGELLSFRYRVTGTGLKKLLQKIVPSFLCGQMFCVVRRGL